MNGAAGDTTLLSIAGVAPVTFAENTSTATGCRRVGNGRRSPGHRNRVLRSDARAGRDIPAAATPAPMPWTSPAPTRIGCPANRTPSPAPTRSPPTPVDVTCTFINARTSASLILQKAWVNGAAGDTAELTVSGSGARRRPGRPPRPRPAPPGRRPTPVNQATATVFSGQAVNLAEALERRQHRVVHVADRL